MTVPQRLASSVADIRARGRHLVELNRELAAAEMKEKGGKFGAAAALFAGAGALALYAVGFLLATIAVALALVLPLWLALLIVTLALFVVVAILAGVGSSLLKQAKQTTSDSAAEAKATAELVRSNLQQTAEGVRAKIKPARAAAGDGEAAPAGTYWGPGPAPTRSEAADERR
jgi:hypothetical protein